MVSNIGFWSCGKHVRLGEPASSARSALFLASPPSVLPPIHQGKRMGEVAANPYSFAKNQQDNQFNLFSLICEACRRRGRVGVRENAKCCVKVPRSFPQCRIKGKGNGKVGVYLRFRRLRGSQRLEVRLFRRRGSRINFFVPVGFGFYKLRDVIYCPYCRRQKIFLIKFFID